MKRIWRYLSPILSLLVVGTIVVLPNHIALADPSSVETDAATNVTSNNATLNGTLTSINPNIETMVINTSGTLNSGTPTTMYNSTWSDAYNNTGNLNASTGWMIEGRVGSDDWRIARFPLKWDTSVIPVGSNITSARIGFHFTGLLSHDFDDDLCVVNGDNTSDSYNIADDYLSLQTANTIYGSISTTDLPSSSDWVWIDLDSAGVAHINLSGLSKFALRWADDINNTSPGTMSYLLMQFDANSGDTSTEAKIEVSYSSSTPGSADCSFEWGLDTSYGNNTTAVSMNSTGTYSSNINGLIGNTLYHFRAKGIGSDNITVYGSDDNFTTPLTVVETLPATNIASTNATLNGNLLDMAGESTLNVFFQYGISTAYGSTTPLKPQTSTGAFQADITGLSVNVEYHFRAVAMSSTSNFTGADLTFTPTEAGGVLQMGGGNARVFFNYITKGDMLFTAEIVNTYKPYYPTQSPQEFFTIQLIDTDNTTVLAATPQQDWGDKPVSIYLNPTQASTITKRAAYSIRVQANFADNVSAQYTLVPSDWKGYDLTKLDSWCVYVAHDMQLYYGAYNYTTILTDRKEVITDAVGGYFTTGIPAIGQVRPNLFTTSQQNPAFNAGISQLPSDNTSAYVSYVGPSIAADAAVLSTPLGITARESLAGILIVGMLLIVGGGVAAMGGFGALGLFLISVPILWIGTYFKIIGVQWMMILVIIFAFFAIRQFFIKTT